MSVKRFGFGAVNFRDAEKEHGAFVLWTDYEALSASHEELTIAVEALLSRIGPHGYFPSAGEPATNGLRKALANAQKVRE